MPLDRNVEAYGNLRIAGLPDYVPGAVLSAASEASEEFSVEHLRNATTDVWASAGLSDRLHTRLEATLAPARHRFVTDVVLGDHNLSPAARVQVRGFADGTDTSAFDDVVLLPGTEIDRGVGATGTFSNAAAGVDTPIPHGVSIASNHFWEVEFPAPAEAPPPGGVHIRALAKAFDVATLRVTLRQPGTEDFVTEVTVDTETEHGILQIGTGDLALAAGVKIRVRFEVLAGSSSHVVLDEVDLVVEKPVAGYRSPWVAVGNAWEAASPLYQAAREMKPDLLPQTLLLPLDDPAAAGLGIWQVRIEDGLNPDGFVSARSLLIGGHFGDPGQLHPGPLREGTLESTVRAPLVRLELADGAEVAYPRGRPRRVVNLGLYEDSEKGIPDVVRLLSAWTAPVCIAVWPANGETDALTFVGVRASEETRHELTEAGLKGLSSEGLSFVEI